MSEHVKHLALIALVLLAACARVNVDPSCTTATSQSADEDAGDSSGAGP